MLSSLSTTSIAINEYGEEESVVILSAEERIKRFGIEIATLPKNENGKQSIKSSIPTSSSSSSSTKLSSEGVNFLAGTWQPNGEYVQKVIVRNVTTNVKKIKYKLPSTQYFSMAYPEYITLSPGLSYEIPVIFKPVRYESYNDCIYFTVYDATGKHGFYIPVIAMINKIMITCPEALEFGYTTVNQLTTKSFELINIGEIDAPFRWVMAEPFDIYPSQGSIPKGKSITMTVSIRPRDASVYLTKSICYVGENITAIIPNPILTMITSAITKYPHISISENDINFADILTGTHSKIIYREVVLRNTSVVPADYRLLRCNDSNSYSGNYNDDSNNNNSNNDESMDEVFDVHPKFGRLEPMSEVAVKIQYTPLAYGLFSCERYKYVTPSNCITSFTCKARSIAATIKYSKDHDLVSPPTSVNTIISPTLPKSINSQVTSNCFDFGDIELGQTAAKTLYIRNDSDQDVFYDIDTEEHGIFSILSSKRGKIPALSSTQIKLLFQPKNPSNYYRRIFVLLSHGHPFFYECFGTGYIRGNLHRHIEEQRPAPLKYEHIQAYRNRLVQGVGHLNPSEIYDIFKSNRTIIDDSMNNNNSNDSNANNNNINTLNKRLLVAKRTSIVDLLGCNSIRDTSASVATLGSTMPLDVSDVKHPLTRSGEATRDVLSIIQEYFIQSTEIDSNSIYSEENIKLIHVNQNYLNFGYNQLNTVSSCKYISVTNQTNGDITAMWELPSLCMFDIYPKNIDIESRKTEIFEIRFKPSDEYLEKEIMTEGGVNMETSNKRNNRYRYAIQTGVFYDELELFCYYSNQKTFRLVKDPTLTPPWCQTIKVSGYTLPTSKLMSSIQTTHTIHATSSTNAVHPAKMLNSNIKKNKLVCPPCYLNDSVYQSIVLMNTSATIPVIFSVTFDTKNVFVVLPSVGYIEPNGYSIVYVKFHPKDTKKYSQSLQVYFNDTLMTPNIKSSVLLSTLGSFEDGSVLVIEGYGGLPYAHLTEVSSEPNALPSTLTTTWSTEEKVSENRMVTVKSSRPSTSMLSGPTINYQHPSSSKISLPQGYQGKFYMPPTSIGLDTIREFPLHNRSRLPLRYRITFSSSSDSNNHNDFFVIQPMNGIIQGNDCKILKIQFYPKFVQIYEQIVHIKIYSLTGESSLGSDMILDARQPGKSNPPDLLQDLSFTMIGSGEQGALLFNPKSIEADVRLVNTSEIKEIYLENISCSNLKYELFYQTDFYPDSAGGILSNEDNVIRSELKPLIEDISNGDALRRDPKHNLFCTYPMGNIEARSKKKLLVTFFPMISGLFRFSIHAKIQVMRTQSDDLQSFRSIEEENFYEEKQDIGIFNDEAIKRRINIPLKPEIESNLSNYFDMIATVTARSAFPTLLFQDIRCSPMIKTTSSIIHPIPIGPSQVSLSNSVSNSMSNSVSSSQVILSGKEQYISQLPQLVHKVDHLWKQFQFTQLNYDLAQPLTEQECIRYTTSTSDRSLFPRYSFHFTPAPLTNPNTIQSIDMLITNNGFLESSFHIHYPNEKELDLEMWCDDPMDDTAIKGLNKNTQSNNNSGGNDSNGNGGGVLNKDMAKALIASTIIEDMKYFTIYPMTGKLQPNESMVITITYTHGIIRPNGGDQRLPLLVKIDQGRQFFIDLIGKTLPEVLVTAPPSPTSKNKQFARRTSFSTVMTATTSKSTKSFNTAITRNTSSRGMTGGRGTDLLGSQIALSDLSPASSVLLWIPTPSNKIYDLSSVPIGTSNKFPPRQRIELFNVSAYPINYEVNMNLFSSKSNVSPSSINISRTPSFGQPLLRISNPIGTVEPRSSIYLNVYFYPLQPIDYLFPLQIKYTKGQMLNERLLESQLDHNSTPGEDTIASSLPKISKQLSRMQSTKSFRTKGLQRTASNKSSFQFNSQPSITPNNNNNIGTSTGSEEHYLEIFLRGTGYDPRKQSKLPSTGSLTVGGIPPIENLIKYSIIYPKFGIRNSDTEIVEVSSTAITFGIIPQYTTVYRLFIIKNTSMGGHEVEYYIKDEDSVLSVEGLLSIQPSKGRIPAGGKVLIQLKIIANSNSTIISDSVQVVAREVIRIHNSNMKRNTIPTALLNDNRSTGQKSKTSQNGQIKEHVSIVNRMTNSRINYLNQTELPFDLQATIPTTINANGSVVLADITTIRAETQTPTEMNIISPLIEDPMVLVAKSLGSYDEDKGFMTRPSSPLHSGDTMLSRVSSSSSMLGRRNSSVRMGRKRSEMYSFSEKAYRTIRITGDIVPIDIVNLMPSSTEITNLTLSTSRSQPQSQTNPPSVVDSLVSKVLSEEFFIPKKEIFLSPPTLSNNSSSNSNNNNNSSASSNSAIHFNQGMNKKTLDDNIAKRQHEIRDMTESVLTEIFGSLLSTKTSIEYIASARLETSLLGKIAISTDENIELHGKPQYGLNIAEVIETTENENKEEGDDNNSNDDDDGSLNNNVNGLCIEGVAEAISDILGDCMFDILKELSSNSSSTVP